jgi:hypothetical protein
MLLTLFGSSLARAQTDCKPVVKSCNEALNRCDEALNTKNHALSLADLALNKCVVHGTILNMQLKDANDELDSWYRNPLIIGAFGLVAGALSYHLLTR